MKAIVIKEKRLVAEEVPMSAIKGDEVLIEVYAAGVNRADVLQVAGNYPPPIGAPDWCGLEVAGVIKKMTEEAKAKSGFSVGDKVCALLAGGGYAEFVSVPVGMVMPIPQGLSMEEAAALPEAFATAYLDLFIEGGAKAGDTLLMHAGASGLASVVIPLAKAFGLNVITTLRNATKKDKIKHLGADLIVDTGTESVAEVLAREEKQGRPVDIVIDCLGGANMGDCLPYVARGCRWIMIATLAGDVSSINLRTMYMKGIKLIGSTLRSRSVEMKTRILRELTENVWERVAAREIVPTLYKVLPLDEAEEAHAMMRRGDQVGKIVLKVK